MVALSQEISEFLDAVSVVGGLEAADAALAEEARQLSSRLAFADDMGWADTTKRLARRISTISRVREDLATTIADICDRESLQVLGRARV